MTKIPNGKKCMVVGCENMVKANDLCAMHYQRSLRHAGHVGETRHRRGTCSVDGCENDHTAKGLCQMHYYRLQRTGTTDDPITAPKICTIEGCGKPHIAQGLCQAHYMRVRRHGTVAQTRASDWGAREKHPLYAPWKALLRYKSADVCERWRNDLWAFTADLGDSRPSKKHIMARLDDIKPFGPDNFYWREQRVAGNTEQFKADRAIYMRGWYRANTDKVLDGELRKRYGITLVEYNRMLDEQGGTCAICHKEETRVDHRSKNISRLAVDHDHSTGKVRGLLCHAHNNSLGHFGDDATLLTSAILYLAKHSTESAAVIKTAIARLQSGTAGNELGA